MKEKETGFRKSTIHQARYANLNCCLYRCFIGKRHLEIAMKEFSNELYFEVTQKPFFLDSTIPEGGVTLEEFLTKKYGPGAAAMAKEGTSSLTKTGANVVKLIC